MRVSLAKRDPAAPAHWDVAEPAAAGAILIVLAVAHLCQDSTCAQLACLRGLRQRCHLRYDHAQQWQTRRRNARAALEAAGQQCFWPADGSAARMEHRASSWHQPVTLSLPTSPAMA